jgi:uracil-DNA glycosylase
MNKQVLLKQIETDVKRCKKCRLCETALNGVPGEGNINSEIVFIGEAPGANEDREGRPFVGRAGKLLEQLLGEIGYSREEVWIGNIIKHRPPGNRDPAPDEIKACEPFLTIQLKTIQPKVVVTLGRFAMNYFYKEGKITNDHGRARRIKAEWGDVVIFPVYHPAAGLRNPEFSKVLREDFKKIPDLLAHLDGGGEIKGTKEEKKVDGQVGLGL